MTQNYIQRKAGNWCQRENENGGSMNIQDHSFRPAEVECAFQDKIIFFFFCSSIMRYLGRYTTLVSNFVFLKKQDNPLIFFKAFNSSNKKEFSYFFRFPVISKMLKKIKNNVWDKLKKIEIYIIPTSLK